LRYLKNAILIHDLGHLTVRIHDLNHLVNAMAELGPLHIMNTTILMDDEDPTDEAVVTTPLNSTPRLNVVTVDVITMTMTLVERDGGVMITTHGLHRRDERVREMMAHVAFAAVGTVAAIRALLHFRKKEMQDPRATTPPIAAVRALKKVINHETTPIVPAAAGTADTIRALPHLRKKETQDTRATTPPIAAVRAMKKAINHKTMTPIVAAAAGTGTAGMIHALPHLRKETQGTRATTPPIAAAVDAIRALLHLQEKKIVVTGDTMNPIAAAAVGTAGTIRALLHLRKKEMPDTRAATPPIAAVRVMMKAIIQDLDLLTEHIRTDQVTEHPLNLSKGTPPVISFMVLLIVFQCHPVSQLSLGLVANQSITLIDQ